VLSDMSRSDKVAHDADGDTTENGVPSILQTVAPPLTIE
jgi:hypothetical protein